MNKIASFVAATTIAGAVLLSNSDIPREKTTAIKAGVEEFKYGSAKEASYRSEEMPLTKRIAQVDLSLALTCRETGFEDAAIVTGHGRANSMKTDSPYRKSVDGVVVGAGLRMKTWLLEAYAPSESKLIILHCHPRIQALSKEHNALPLHEDIQTATDYAERYYSANPKGDISFRIPSFIDQELSVIEYRPKPALIKEIILLEEGRLAQGLPRQRKDPKNNVFSKGIASDYEVALKSILSSSVVTEGSKQYEKLCEVISRENRWFHVRQAR